jgi:hypothetical protein
VKRRETRLLTEKPGFFVHQNAYCDEDDFGMAVLLQIRDAHKSYGEQVLLDGADATLTDDVKVGFARCCGPFSAKRNSTGGKSCGIPGCGWDICASTIRFCPVKRPCSF